MGQTKMNNSNDSKVPQLVKSKKELQAEVEELRARLERLELIVNRPYKSDLGTLGTKGIKK